MIEFIREVGGQKGGIKLTKRQKEVLMLIIENPGIEQEELVAILGINRWAIQKHINVKKNSNIIERIGGKKLGYRGIIGEVEWKKSPNWRTIWACR